MGKKDAEPVGLKSTILRLVGNTSAQRMLTTLIDSCIAEVQKLPKLHQFIGVLEKAKEGAKGPQEGLFKTSSLLEKNLGVLNKALEGGKKLYEAEEEDTFNRFMDLYVASMTLCFACWLPESEDTDEFISID